MPWGKHKGEYIEDLPSSYLVWIKENSNNLNHYLEVAIDKELSDRFSIKKQENQNIKAVYYKLSMIYHPDKGGSNLAMQAINDFYNKIK